MGRVRSKPAQPGAGFACKALACQYGGRTTHPKRLGLMAALACVLFAAVAFSQTTHDSATEPADSSAQDPAIPAALDTQLNVANPFATPWLVSSALLATLDPKKIEGKASNIANTPLPKTKHRLEPDPFDLNALLNAPQDDERGISSPPLPDTAARLAAQPATLKPSKSPSKSLQAKYDITRIGDRGVGNKLNFFSIEREQALGRELSQQVEQQAKLITDPVITEYVNRIGQTLVRHSDARVPFTIKVVDDEQVNAFALPGGFFYVNTGVVLAADNEAELAGVMAHEIAHVAARHATRNATRHEMWDLASIPLVFVGGPVGAAIRQFSSIMVPMSFLKFSRDSEREADFLGLEYQYASGYDPTAFVDFFEKLEAQEKGRTGFIARAFSTHPMNDDRIRRAETELEMLPARDDYILTTSEFDQVKARVIQLTRGRRVDAGKPGMPTLRKHTVEDDGPPVLHKKPGAME